MQILKKIDFLNKNQGLKYKIKMNTFIMTYWDVM